MSVEIHSHSEVNQPHREHQEDFLAWYDGGNYLGQHLYFGLVADGLGGHSHGEDASREAVETVFKLAEQDWGTGDLREDNWEIKIMEYLEAAKAALHAHKKKKYWDDRDTTMVGAFYFPEAKVVKAFTVGDSTVGLYSPRFGTPKKSMRQGVGRFVSCTISTFSSGRGLERKPDPILYTWFVGSVDEWTVALYTDGLDEIMDHSSNVEICTATPEVTTKRLCTDGAGLSTDNCTIVTINKRP